VRNDADLERIHSLAKGLVIKSEWRLQESGAGKCHQSKAITPGQPHQIKGGQFRLFQPIRGHVLRQHAARSVDGDNDVEPSLFGFLPGKTPLRPGQRDEQAGHGGGEEGQAQGLTAR